MYLVTVMLALSVVVAFIQVLTNHWAQPLTAHAHVAGGEAEARAQRRRFG